MVAASRVRMRKFVLVVLNFVSKECKTTILINDMKILTLMTYAEQIEDWGV